MANQSPTGAAASGVGGSATDRASTSESDKKVHQQDDSQKQSNALKESDDLKRGNAGKMFKDDDKAKEDQEKAGQPSSDSDSR